MSNLHGLLEKIIEKVNAAVKTEAQTLTDAEKVQALENIGAAPKTMIVDLSGDTANYTPREINTFLGNGGSVYGLVERESNYIYIALTNIIDGMAVFLTHFVSDEESMIYGNMITVDENGNISNQVVNTPLVSTVNGQSGDVTIEPETLVVDFITDSGNSISSSMTYADIEAAFNDGKVIMGRMDDFFLKFEGMFGDYAEFIDVYQDPENNCIISDSIKVSKDNHVSIDTVDVGNSSAKIMLVNVDPHDNKADKTSSEIQEALNNGVFVYMNVYNGFYLSCVGARNNTVVFSTITSFTGTIGDAGLNALYVIVDDDGTAFIVESQIPTDVIQSPSTAEVGQTLVVKNVDENGAPIEWEAADDSVRINLIDYGIDAYAMFAAGGGECAVSNGDDLLSKIQGTRNITLVLSSTLSVFDGYRIELNAARSAFAETYDQLTATGVIRHYDVDYELSLIIKNLGDRSPSATLHVTQVGGAQTAAENECFIAEYGVTAYAEVVEAYEAGKLCFVKYGDALVSLGALNGNKFQIAYLTGLTAGRRITLDASNGWTTGTLSYQPASLTQEINESSTATKYPSAKAVYDYVAEKTTKTIPPVVELTTVVTNGAALTEEESAALTAAYESGLPCAIRCVVKIREDQLSEFYFTTHKYPDMQGFVIQFMNYMVIIAVIDDTGLWTCMMQDFVSSLLPTYTNVSEVGA